MPKTMRLMFRALNRFLMVPMFRLGLGSMIVSPLAGYIMVMKTIGRKSGKVRYAPVNYAIWKGKVYCLSGGREGSDWYKNLLAHPEIELILPGGAMFARVAAPYAGEDRLAILRQVLKNAGFAGFFEGYNPWMINDAELQERSVDIPVLEFTPLGLGSGASDPQGWAWVSWLLLLIVVVLLLVILL